VAEKWVVVEMSYDNEYVDEVHGIFDSKNAAEVWASLEFYSKPYEVRRIRRAVVEEWA
jgi:hypothetical protein